MPLPAGHAGVIRREVLPTLPEPPRKPALNGERVYVVNCAACHQQGQQVGRIAALRGAKSLQDPNWALAIIVRGNRNGMPAWRMLPDQDIADVTNYVIGRFGAVSVRAVSAEDARRAK